MSLNQRLERLDGLAVFLRPPVLRLVELCQIRLSRTLFIVHGWRSVQEQMLIYQRGRTYNRETQEWDETEPAAIVTKAKPGTTAHNVISRTGARASVAVDVIPFDGEGRLDWDVGMEFWDALYELAWQVGLDPLGDRVGAHVKWDLGHFEEPGWQWKLDGLGLLLPVSDVARLA